jgi:hypothetical protein
MIDGCAREAAGRSVAELERFRDSFLAELLMLLERYSLNSIDSAGNGEVSATRSGTETADVPSGKGHELAAY